MSIPPQVIHVKRKRVEEAPVTFLKFDEGAKRHRSGTNWVYQRKDGAPPRKLAQPRNPIDPYRDAKPVIHISEPSDHVAPASTKKRLADDNGAPAAPAPAAAGTSSPRTLSQRPSQQRLRAAHGEEKRRFHISRAMLRAAAASAERPGHGGVSKRGRTGPAVFIERGQRKLAKRAMKSHTPSSEELHAGDKLSAVETPAQSMPEQRPLKKPGTTARARSPKPPDAPKREPLPSSLMNPDSEDMNKRTADMNQWVLNEIGANLAEMEHDAKRQPQPSPLKYHPKIPTKRYHERHPEVSQQKDAKDTPDTAMSDATDDEGDDEDWVIEEYIRIPASSMAVDISAAEVGVLVLDEELDNMLFFGPEQDDDDDYAEDDEDENAENHYTADYPEDEVDTDDEYNRHPYLFRNANASDDEEFDNDLYSDNDDEMVLEGHVGEDEDVTMARIRTYMRRNAARR